MDYELVAYLIWDAMRRDDAEASGEINFWPTIESDFPEGTLAYIEREAQRYAVDGEAFLAALTHRYANMILRRPLTGTTAA